MKIAIKNIILFFCVIIVASACRKKPVIIPPVKEEVCQIKQVILTSATYFKTDTAKFTYNNMGNPVSVLFSHVGTGNPNALFRYDKYNRLTDFIGAFSFSEVIDASNMPAVVSFEYWLRYVYADQDPSSMPVSDTFRVLGQYTGGKFVNTNAIYIQDIKYDSQERIIRDNGYDAYGNLIIPNLTYDDKKNYKQTNKVWMLIDRDYSRNNPFYATTYNEAGLPTTFGAPAPRPYHDNFLFRQMTFLKMDYSCFMVPGGQ